MKSLLPWLWPVITFLAGWALSASRESSLPKTPQPVVASMGDPISAHQPAAAAGAKDETSRLESQPIPLVPLTEALRSPSILHRLAAFGRIVDSLDAAQLESLHRELSALPELDSRLWQYFFRRWARLAPEAAAKAGLRHGGMLSTVFHVWGRADPKAALAWFNAQNLPLTHERLGVRENLLKELSPKAGETAPVDAVRQILALGNSRDGKYSALSQDLRMAMLRWAQADPAAAWRAALAIEASDSRRQIALAAVIATLASTDPSKCQRAIEHLTDPVERASLTGVLAQTLAWKTSVSAAREFALGLPSGDARRAALGEVAWTMQRKEPGAFGTFMASLPAADFQDPAPYRQALQEWLTRQPEQAVDFLLARLPSNLTPSDSRAAVYQQLLGTSLQALPKRKAIEIFLQFPAAVRTPVLDGTILQLVTADAAATAQWASDFPRDADRGILVESVARHWSERSPGEVTEWLHKLPQGPVRSAAVEGFAGSIISASPDDALAWLQSLADDAERVPRLQRVWRAWADRDSAQRWRDANPDLTAAERAALTEPDPAG